MAYGASAYYVLISPKGINRAQEIVKKLIKIENNCLRTVLGAYKATSIRALHTEAAFPLLDLYLNNKRLRFEEKIPRSALEKPLNQAIIRLRAHFSQDKRSQRTQKTLTKT